MCEDLKARITIKQGVGKATVPATSSHKDGTWLATDIYEGEFYQDAATGIIYNRAGSTVTINGEPVKAKYRATLTQAGATNPTPTILVNTIGALTVTRTGTGTYEIGSSALFTADKTSVLVGQTINPQEQVRYFRKTTSIVEIKTYNTGVLTDGILRETALSIEIFL